MVSASGDSTDGGSADLEEPQRKVLTEMACDRGGFAGGRAEALDGVPLTLLERGLRHWQSFL